MLAFFFDQFKVPIIGLTILGIFVFVRIFLVPVRVDKIRETNETNEDVIQEKANIAD